MSNAAAMQAARARYTEVAKRFARRFGPPPPMPVALDVMREVTSAMIARLHGTVDDGAGPGVTIAFPLDVHLTLDEERIELVATASMLDAEGRRAGMRRVALHDGDVPDVRDAIRDAVLRALQ